MTLGPLSLRPLGAGGPQSAHLLQGGHEAGAGGAPASWLSFRKAAVFRLASLLGVGSPSLRAPSSAPALETGPDSSSEVPKPGPLEEAQPPAAARSRSRCCGVSPAAAGAHQAAGLLPLQQQVEGLGAGRPGALAGRERGQCPRGWGWARGLGRSGGSSSASSALCGPAMPPGGSAALCRPWASELTGASAVGSSAAPCKVLCAQEDRAPRLSLLLHTAAFHLQGLLAACVPELSMGRDSPSVCVMEYLQPAGRKQAMRKVCPGLPSPQLEPFQHLLAITLAYPHLFPA